MKPSPTWINGVPWCDCWRCENYDGQWGCMIGRRLGRICEPAVADMSKVLDAGERVLDRIDARFPEIDAALERCQKSLDALTKLVLASDGRTYDQSKAYDEPVGAEPPEEPELP